MPADRVLRTVDGDLRGTRRIVRLFAVNLMGLTVATSNSLTISIR